MYINVLLCSTVLGKRRFSVEQFKDCEDLAKCLPSLAKNHPDMVIYPIISEKNLEDISDILEKKQKLALLEEKEFYKAKLCAYHGNFIFKDVVRIEHVYDNIFRFATRNLGCLSTDSYRLVLRWNI